MRSNWRGEKSTLKRIERNASKEIKNGYKYLKINIKYIKYIKYKYIFFFLFYPIFILLLGFISPINQIDGTPREYQFSLALYNEMPRQINQTRQPATPEKYFLRPSQKRRKRMESGQENTSKKRRPEKRNQRKMQNCWRLSGKNGENEHHRDTHDIKFDI